MKASQCRNERHERADKRKAGRKGSGKKSQIFAFQFLVHTEHASTGKLTQTELVSKRQDRMIGKSACNDLRYNLLKIQEEEGRI